MPLVGRGANDERRTVAICWMRKNIQNQADGKTRTKPSFHSNSSCRVRRTWRWFSVRLVLSPPEYLVQRTIYKLPPLLAWNLGISLFHLTVQPTTFDKRTTFLLFLFPKASSPITHSIGFNSHSHLFKLLVLNPIPHHVSDFNHFDGPPQS